MNDPEKISSATTDDEYSANMLAGAGADPECGTGSVGAGGLGA